MAPLSTEWISFLKKVPFFSQLNEEEINEVLQQMSLLTLPAGAMLFQQNEPGDSLYVIHSGRIRLFRKKKSDEKTLAYLGRGDVTGEMSAINGGPRPHTALAETSTELLVLYRSGVDYLMQHLPAFAANTSRIFSHRLLETTRPESRESFPFQMLALTDNLPLPEKVLFHTNLALSLLEQSRRKVLLMDLFQPEPGLFVRSLGLKPHPPKGKARLEELLTPGNLRQHALFHPSGLEVLDLCPFFGDRPNFQALSDLVNVLRKSFDIILLVTPPENHALLEALERDITHYLPVEKDASQPTGTDPLLALGDKTLSEKTLRINLVRPPARADTRPPFFEIAWDESILKEYEKKRSPFLSSSSPLTVRTINRLARRLTGLRVGFALGSGAALGYSLIGFLRVMERHGIFPDIISGTSMGALLGSFYAAGHTPEEMREIALTITKKKMMSLLDMTLPWQGMLSGGKVLQFLKSVLGEKTFEDLALPFACVATDIRSGEEVVLKKGNVAEAVRASLSLPFFFQPVPRDSRYLVDGGLVNPVPTSITRSLGADILISANLTTKPQYKRSPWLRRPERKFLGGPSMVEILTKTIYTMQFEIAQSRSEIAHVALAPDLSAFNWADFHRSKNIMDAGETFMEETIPKVKSLLPFYADYCRVPLRPRTPLDFD